MSLKYFCCLTFAILQIATGIDATEDSNETKVNERNGKSKFEFNSLKRRKRKTCKEY